MALLKNVEMWFPRLEAGRPNKRFNPKNPTWEVQLRTTDKDVKKEWENLKLSVKAVVPDEGVPFYRVNLKKKSIKADGTESEPVNVVDGKLKPIDASSIGNGSIGNVRIFQYEYTDQVTNKKKTASVLMGVQVTKLIVFVQKERDDEFEESDMETITPDSEEAEF